MHLLIFILLLFPQQSETVIQCKLVNLDPSPTLVCDDAHKSTLQLAYSEWPAVWRGPHLGAVYKIEAKSGFAIPVEVDPNLDKSIRAKSNAERERWQRKPMGKVD